MSMRQSRRAFLAGITGSAVGLAGCGSRGEVRELTSPTFESLVSAVTVGSRDVVVELASSDVTEVVLIGPDGTAFDSQEIQPGVSTVRFPILELDLELSRSLHYPPGQYEVVVVADDREFTKQLVIAPEIRVAKVNQYREGNELSDFAKIVFRVDNVGTGPTWVYDASYQESPNYSANGGLNGSPSIPYLKKPNTEDELILAPGETQSYIDTSTPLAFSEEQVFCRGQLQPFIMQIGIADGSVLKTTLSPTLGGDPKPLDFADQSVCTRVEISAETLSRSQ